MAETNICCVHVLEALDHRPRVAPAADLAPALEHERFILPVRILVVLDQKLYDVEAVFFVFLLRFLCTLLDEFDVELSMLARLFRG